MHSKGKKSSCIIHWERRISYWIQLGGGGKRIVMTNLRFLPNIRTREAKNITFLLHGWKLKIWRGGLGLANDNLIARAPQKMATRWQICILWGVQAVKRKFQITPKNILIRGRTSHFLLQHPIRSDPTSNGAKIMVNKGVGIFDGITKFTTFQN